MVKAKRPVNLDLMTMTFPPMAIASILHRLSGLLLLVLLPYILYLLQHSLQSDAGFMQTKLFLGFFMARFWLWAFLSALIYHFIAGIRHLLMDYGLGETLAAGRNSALVVMILSAILIVLLGICLW